MATELEFIVGLLPGQGAYRPGYLLDRWSRGEPSVREVFDVIDEVSAELMGDKVSSRIFAGRPPTLDEMLTESPDLLQLSIFGISVAIYRIFEAENIGFSALVGHSLGEIAALVCGGAFTVEQGATIISHRCAAMQKFAPVDSRMLALQSDRATVEKILELVADPSVVVAVENGPEQTVISGSTQPVNAASSIASALGIGTTALRAPYAFHHPALGKASADWIAQVGRQPQQLLTTPVYSPILRRYYRDCDDLVALLGSHLVNPVMFGTTVDAFHQDGGSVFVELGAGSALTGAVAIAHPDVTVLRPLSGPNERSSIAHAIEFLAPNRISDSRSATAPTEPDRRPPAVPAQRSKPAQLDVRSRDTVFEELRTLYATELEYPEEVFAEDVQLEADLGIDSLKQSEMFLKLKRQYDLDLPSVDASLWAIDTFGKVVDYVHSGLAESPVK